MTTEQQQGAAAGFLHLLHVNPAIRDEWMKTPKDDYDKVAALVQRSLGLAQKPSSDDMKAMATHASQALQPQIDQVVASNPDAPRHVGLIVYMQQNS